MPFGSAGLHNISVAELVYELEQLKKGAKWRQQQEEEEQVAKVLVLYTGGTIGMKPIKGAYAPCPGYLPSMMAEQSTLNDRQFVSRHFADDFPLRPLCLPPVRGTRKRIVYWMVEYAPLLDSCDMTFDDWIRIAVDIETAYRLFDGFVVLHGTDTLAYTSSALSFLMEGLDKPVVVTGSQIPVAEVRSDGLYNFVGALVAAGNLNIPEVCVYFNNKLMRGNCTVKVDNASLDAFDSPNLPPLARMAIGITVNEKLIWRPKRREKEEEEGQLRVQQNLCRDVGVVRFFPSIPIETIRACIPPHLKGVILQTFGAGNISSRRPDIIEVLKEAIDRGCLVVNCSQCLKGCVTSDYASGRRLQEVGVLAGRDLTAEAAMTKLSYVLGRQDWNGAARRSMMEKSLRGEMTD